MTRATRLHAWVWVGFSLACSSSDTGAAGVGPGGLAGSAAIVGSGGGGLTGGGFGGMTGNGGVPTSSTSGGGGAAGKVAASSGGASVSVGGAGGSVAVGGSAGGGSLCAGCGSGLKLCSGLCVSATQDPHFGCNADTCAHCSLPHAQPTCSGGTCVVQACEPEWADCNGDPADGCEADLLSPETCTGCNIKCAPPNGLCSAGGCVPSCTPPLTQCGDRCVNLLDSQHNCGACGATCSVAPSSDDGMLGGFPGSCINGACGSPAVACWSGYNACGTQQLCYELSSDPLGCGTECKQCAPPQDGFATCVNGQCGVVCLPGWTICNGTCITTQTDPLNCGGCGNVCNVGDVCIAAQCMPSSATWLAAGLTSPFGLAVDDTNVYWTDVGDQTIRSVPRVGGPIAILAQNQAKPYGIAVDGANAYWSNNLGGAIMRAPKDGTGIVTIVAPATLPLDIAVDANFVYWLESDAIRKAPIAGGASTVVAAGGTSGFGGPLIFDGVSTLCTHLGGAVVCYDTSGNVVGGTAGSFGTYYPLAMDSSCICEWQIFATTLLCTSWKSPPPKCVGGWYQVVPTVQAIALNPCAVFWAESNAIWMAPRGGGQLSAGNLARVVPDVMTTHLVANAGWLFWSDVSAIGAVPIP